LKNKRAYTSFDELWDINRNETAGDTNDRGTKKKDENPIDRSCVPVDALFVRCFKWTSKHSTAMSESTLVYIATYKYRQKL
jgi:hypothetical protein